MFRLDRCSVKLIVENNISGTQENEYQMMMVAGPTENLCDGG